MADNRKISMNRKRKVVRKGNLFVISGVAMAKYDKKSALKIIVNAAREYDVKLKNKHS